MFSQDINARVGNWLILIIYRQGSIFVKVMINSITFFHTIFSLYFSSLNFKYLKRYRPKYRIGNENVLRWHPPPKNCLPSISSKAINKRQIPLKSEGVCGSARLYCITVHTLFSHPHEPAYYNIYRHNKSNKVPYYHKNDKSHDHYLQPNDETHTQYVNLGFIIYILKCYFLQRTRTPNM